MRDAAVAHRGERLRYQQPRWPLLRQSTTHEKRGALVGVLLAAAVGTLVGFEPMAGAGVLAAAGGFAIWRIGAKWSTAVLALALLPMAFGLLTPRSLEAGVEGVLAAVAAGRTVAAAYQQDPRWKLAAALLAVPCLWLILGLNGNEPGVSVALLGARKTTLVFVAAAVGAVWPRDKVGKAEELIIALLFFGGSISLVIHVLMPGFESGLSRSSGLYTGLFADKPRLEGIFSGPFHVALLGAFFLLRAWHLLIAYGRRRLWLASAMAVLGLPLVILAEVRTAYIVVGLGMVLTLLLSPRSAGRVRMSRILLGSAAAVLVAVLLLASGLSSNAAVSSLSALGTNSRATGRLSALQDGVAAFVRSPIYGYGPGSAGSADGYLFVNKVHITADNEFLALLLEGGLVGILAIGSGIAVFLRGSKGLTNPEHPSAAAAYCLVGFCISTNAFEAIPVSTFLALLIGLAATYESATGHTAS